MLPNASTRDQYRAQTVEDGLGVVRETVHDLFGWSEAVFSTDGHYRYLLTRRWAVGGTTATFVGLNPSVASASVKDPTSTRVVSYARLWGHSAANILNLYGYKATDPREMFRAADPVGPLNDEFLRRVCQPGWLTVAAWGAFGNRNGRGQQVADMLTDAGVDLTCLGLTGSGSPGTPSTCSATSPRSPTGQPPDATDEQGTRPAAKRQPTVHDKPQPKEPHWHPIAHHLAAISWSP